MASYFETGVGRLAKATHSGIYGDPRESSAERGELYLQQIVTSVLKVLRDNEAMFRRYNRWHSRFDQPDPYDGSYDVSDPQSFNRYAYTQNDPANFVDPTGLTYNVCGAEFSAAQCMGDGFGVAGST